MCGYSTRKTWLFQLSPIKLRGERQPRNTTSASNETFVKKTTHQDERLRKDCENGTSTANDPRVLCNMLFHHR